VGGRAQLPSASDDRELLRRDGLADRARHDRVGGLVDRDDPALGLRQDVALLRRPGDHAVDRLLEDLLGDRGLALTDGQKRRFVDDVCELGAGEAGRQLRDLHQRRIR
jgi:hypothetical protein